jgi:hypothetical protein
VTVDGIDLTDRGDRGDIVAICSRGRFQQSIPLLDLPLRSPPPDGADWIEAHRHWAEPHSGWPFTIANHDQPKPG